MAETVKVKDAAVDHSMMYTCEVTLTRAQVEAALAELNKPLKFEGGQIVIWQGARCLVGSVHMDTVYKEYHKSNKFPVEDKTTIVDLHDGSICCVATKELKHAK